MLQSHKVPMPHKLDWGLEISDVLGLLVPLFDNKQVVLILVGIACDLLLLGPHPLRIKVEVRVEVATASPMVLQGDDGTVGYLAGHGGIGQVVALQGGLEQGTVEAIS